MSSPETTLPAESVPKPKGSKKHLTKTQWAEAKTMWASGNYTLTEIAERFNVTPVALHRRFKRHGIEKGQDKQAQDEAVRKSAIEKNAAAIAEVARTGIDAALLMTRSAKTIAQLIVQEMGRTQAMGDAASGIPWFRMHANLRALREAMNAMKDGSVLINNFVDISALQKEIEEGELPELRILTMDQDEIDRMREEQRRQDAELNGLYDGDEEVDDDVIEIVDDEETGKDESRES